MLTRVLLFTLAMVAFFPATAEARTRPRAYRYEFRREPRTPRVPRLERIRPVRPARPAVRSFRHRDRRWI